MADRKAFLISQAKRHKSAYSSPAEERAPAKSITKILEESRERESSKLDEASRTEVSSWLTKTAEVVSSRGDDISSSDEQQKFRELASLIKESIPSQEADESEIRRLLKLLKERIEVTDKDSDHLRQVKNHIRLEIDKIL